MPCVTGITDIQNRDYCHINNNNFTKHAHKHASCHHELSEDEIWIGNTMGSDPWTKGVDIPKHYTLLKTIRLGEQAYCIEGKPLSIDYCRPLIINKAEQALYDKMYNERYKEASMRYSK